MKTEVKTNNKNKPKKTTNRSKKKQSKKKNIKLRRIVAVIISVILLAGIVVLILMSGLFSIKKITVINNLHISKERIMADSNIKTGDNLFRTLKSSIKSGVKSNPYIEDVKIKKKLNGEIILDVQERTPTFMLQGENSYWYINNQGYILENTNVTLSAPIITGYATKDIKLGNRLEKQDLKRLDIVIQIMESAKSNGLSDKIYSIDISDANNYILDIPSESKMVHFGDGTNINVKMLWILDLIEREKGIAGDIMLNVSNIKKVYFRERV